MGKKPKRRRSNVDSGAAQPPAAAEGGDDEPFAATQARAAKKARQNKPEMRRGGNHHALVSEDNFYDIGLAPNANSKKAVRKFNEKTEKEQAAHVKWMTEERDADRFALSTREREIWERNGRGDVLTFVQSRKAELVDKKRMLREAREASDSDAGENDLFSEGEDSGTEHPGRLAAPKLPAVDWAREPLATFRRNFWSAAIAVGGVEEHASGSASGCGAGDDGAGDDADDGAGDDAELRLKRQRQALHIVVRGRCPPPISVFDDPALPDEIQAYFRRGGAGAHHKEPTVVQRQCWPAMLSGVQLLGVAPTGSGKTLAFLLPGLVHVQARRRQQEQLQHGTGGGARKRMRNAGVGPLMLVVLPTRELADQVAGVAQQLYKQFSVRSLSCTGGNAKSKAEQIDALRESPRHIIAGTPGRLLELMEMRALALTSVSLLIIDEADQMLALGFEKQLDAIASQIRPDRQVALFSATFPQQLRLAASRWLSPATAAAGAETAGHASVVALRPSLDDDFVFVRCGAFNQPSELASGAGEGAAGSGTKTALGISPTVSQVVRVCDGNQKAAALASLLKRVRAAEAASDGVAIARNTSGVIIFCNTTARADTIVAVLKSDCAERAAPLHGALAQRTRQQAVLDFRAGKLSVLVATDLAARGLHFARAKYVVHYDAPQSIEKYVHRTGRVGRGGAKGFSFCLLVREEQGDCSLARALVPLLEATAQKVDASVAKLAAVEEARVDEQRRRSAAKPTGAALLPTLDAEDINALKPSMVHNPFAPAAPSVQREKAKKWTSRGKRGSKGRGADEKVKVRRKLTQKPGKKNKKKLMRKH